MDRAFLLLEACRRKRKFYGVMVVSDGEVARVGVETDAAVVRSRSELIGSSALTCATMCRSARDPIMVMATESGTMSVNGQQHRVPERLRCVCGQVENYLFGGGASGVLYCWELWSGRMVRKWDAHYKGVNAICATDDLLITAADDALIRIWHLVKIFDESDDRTFTSSRTLDAHTLPATALALFSGVNNDLSSSSFGRIASVSLDRTLKIWDTSGTVLTSKTFAEPLTSVAVDTRETTIIVGSSRGHLFCVDVLRLDDDDSKKRKLTSVWTQVLEAAEKTGPIVALRFLESDLFLSASSDGSVRLWHPRNGLPVQVPSLSGKPVRAILVDDAEDSSSAKKKKTKTLVADFFQKQPKALPSDTIPLRLLQKQSTPETSKPFAKATSRPDSLVPKLLSDLDILRAENDRWKSVCDSLWHIAHTNIANTSPSSPSPKVA